MANPLQNMARSRRPFGPATLTALGVLALGAALPGERGAALAQGMFDINQVMWCEGRPIGDQTVEQCEAARTSVQTNCTGCHSIPTIITVQKTPEEWDAIMAIHRPRVPEMSEEELEQIATFLKAHFNPDNPVPELPPALLGPGAGEAF